MSSTWREEMDRWHGLANLFASLDYWSEVQTTLAQQGAFETAAPLFGRPYLDGNRLLFPRGPGADQDSEGYTDYSIHDVADHFALEVSGQRRGRTYENVAKAWFSDFADIAKYFVGSNVASRTRSRYRPANLEIINHRWLDRGPAPLWDQVREPNPGGFDRAVKYFRSDHPERWYFTVTTDSDTSFMLDLPWRELNSIFSEGIPGIEHIPFPKFSDG
ncbi:MULTISPECIES: hypothetical protein [Gordonia]|uniref:hypothetical protein n=1 Tax=Gordonia TaxID=2053 RepID=UPI0002A63068|nr:MULTISPECIES: hypothetical protein [Gordonia]MDV7102689.1 hypothetical protein [Gordonia amicalis]GAC55205.1 hypothetical protein GOAMI_47_00480 [Gordonia amicalis NBRC 100051 = JCM 11271]